MSAQDIPGSPVAQQSGLDQVIADARTQSEDEQS
jgi:hypothetical protein